MKVLAVIDSFKGSMTSLEAGQAAASGILRADPSAQVTVRALADGGEGTVEALTSNMGGRIRSVRVTGPLGDPVMCGYGIIDAASTAVIEMAGAAGLLLVPEEKRNPLYTTTYGVGEVIRDAIAQGCRRFIIGIGGSATNDGGVGMLQALGYGFLDKQGRPAAYGASGLKDLETITDDLVIPELSQCCFRTLNCPSAVSASRAMSGTCSAADPDAALSSVLRKVLPRKWSGRWISGWPTMRSWPVKNILTQIHAQKVPALPEEWDSLS